MRVTPVAEPETRVNERGNTIKSWGAGIARALCGDERYYWDFGPCAGGTGWTQYDTDQDAWYFGVWVHLENRLVLTYAEGDLSLVECPTAETFKAELNNLAEFYGAPPPSMVAIGDDGVTEYFDERPGYESQTPDEARARIAENDKASALAWLEQVGSWPSSDGEVQKVTESASRLLGFPV